jgi:orotidine-5'-phosphate decarboxylase
MNFMHALNAAWHDRNSLLCIGLDPDPARFPAHLRDQPEAILTFCKAIVDATADLVCSYKPQIAYFAARRAEDQLQALIAHIHNAHPTIPVILDAKRGDIGSTAEQYAIEAFERFQADALTVNPYMGRDSIEPYLAYGDKGVILLCRTSNPGGSDLQFLDVGGEKLYERLARLVSQRLEPGRSVRTRRRCHLPRRNRPRPRAHRRHAAARARNRCPGRRHRSHRPRRLYGNWQWPADQFLARHPLRRKRRGLRRRGAARGDGHP